MIEQTKAWLIEMYTEAINNHRKQSYNEHIWALGSKTQQEAEMHEKNSDKHKESINILKNLIKELSY